ncbi:MAG: tetratricopeptide repeat protein, partial [Planctomycetes bacterium]|nr:tetratricopeptide repeat protein [Planctomycetota bacterium]
MQRDRRANRLGWRRWLLLALAVLATSNSGVFGREWSDSVGGFKVEAELVDLEKGEVRLLREDGKLLSIPLERLSVSDRKYVYVQMGRQPAAHATAKRIVRGERLEDLEPPRRWALLIGVDDYNELSDLKYCVADAKAMREGLLGAGFHEERIWLLTTDAESPKYLPFKANVQRQMELVLGQVGPRDLVVVALSGHGIHIDGTSYFCAVEARPETPEETMVSLEYVYESLSACDARQKLLLVDACRNDPRVEGTRSVADGKSTLEFSQTLEKPPQGILALSSCAPGELSFEDGVFGHGVFMHFLVEGLAGKADREEGNGDGEVSLLELYRYSSTHTKGHVARQYYQSQTPMLRGEIPLDFEISTARIAPEVQAALDRGDEFQRKGRYEEAEAAYTEAIRMDDECVTAYNRRGVSHSRREDWDSAILDHTLAMHLKPKESLYWANRGGDYSRKGEHDRAIADLDEAIRLDPEYAPAYNNRGLVYDNKGDHDRAIDDYYQAIRINPEYAPAYNNRGVAYKNKREYDRAIADYDEAI